MIEIQNKRRMPQQHFGHLNFGVFDLFGISSFVLGVS